jgi:hypothetical protein
MAADVGHDPDPRKASALAKEYPKKMCLLWEIWTVAGVVSRKRAKNTARFYPRK